VLLPRGKIIVEERNECVERLLIIVNLQ